MTHERTQEDSFIPGNKYYLEFYTDNVAKGSHPSDLKKHMDKGAIHEQAMDDEAAPPLKTTVITGVGQKPILNRSDLESKAVIMSRHMLTSLHKNESHNEFKAHVEDTFDETVGLRSVTIRSTRNRKRSLLIVLTESSRNIGCRPTTTTESQHEL